jgi:excisionase family DNA binding protein
MKSSSSRSEASRVFTDMNIPVQPKCLNPETASKYCGLSIRTLKRRIKEGCFKTYTKGRRVLIDRESLDAWINDREGANAADSSVIEQIAADVRVIRELLERMASAG